MMWVWFPAEAHGLPFARVSLVYMQITAGLLVPTEEQLLLSDSTGLFAGEVRNSLRLLTIGLSVMGVSQARGKGGCDEESAQ